MNTIQQLNPNDVLCGRGSGPNDYSGNIKFRALVMNRRDEYLSTSNRASKAKIAREIVDYVRRMSPPGRFLEQMEGSGKAPLWRAVSEEKSLEKAKQALRQNRHRRGPGSGNESFGVTSPSASMGSNCGGDNTSPAMMNGHYRSFSYTANANTGRDTGHVRSSSHHNPLMHPSTPMQNYHNYNRRSPDRINRAMSAGPDAFIPMQPMQNYHNPNRRSPDQISRAMSTGTDMRGGQHRRHSSDHAPLHNSHGPPGQYPPTPRHHRAYSERQPPFNEAPDRSYYRAPPSSYYNYRPEQIDYFDQDQNDRKYFNNYESTHVESPDEDIYNDSFGAMPDPVPSKRRHFDTLSPSNIPINPANYFEPEPLTQTDSPPRDRMLSVESNDYQPKRNRMHSADSDISAIELDMDSITEPEPTEPFPEPTFNTQSKDPMSISDFPDDILSNNTAHKRSSDFDINPEMMKDFDMSYYVLQTIGDDMHDL